MSKPKWATEKVEARIRELCASECEGWMISAKQISIDLNSTCRIFVTPNAIAGFIFREDIKRIGNSRNGMAWKGEIVQLPPRVRIKKPHRRVSENYPPMTVTWAWPEDTIERVVAMWAEGLELPAIAMRIERSLVATRKKTERMVRSGVLVKRVRQEKTVTRPSTFTPQHASGRGASVLWYRGLRIGDMKGVVEHRIGMCRWALTCNEPSTHGNWCEGHAAMLRRKAA